MKAYQCDLCKEFYLDPLAPPTVFMSTGADAKCLPVKVKVCVEIYKFERYRESTDPLELCPKCIKTALTKAAETL